MYRSLLDLPFDAAQRFPARVVHKWRGKGEPETRTFAEFAEAIRVLAAGLVEAGIGRGDHVAFFVNNRPEWATTDFAIMTAGAISVPRGSDTPPREAAFIFRHSDARHLIVERTEQVAALSGYFTADDWARCTTVVVVEDGAREALPEAVRSKTTFYSELMTRGRVALERDPDLVTRRREEIRGDDLLTIVYTSGTTGNPKGVMLTHGNFLQNVHANTPRLGIDPAVGETTVVMLPSWHVYERAFEYCCLTVGVTVVYSSASRFAADLLAERPQVLISVPRVWESIYQKLIKALSELPAFKRALVLVFIKLNQSYLTSAAHIRGCYLVLKRRPAWWRAAIWGFHAVRAGLLYPGHLLAGVLFRPMRAKVGGRLRLATCGAGSLPKYLDELFNAIGIPLINAYGMTECAPGILSRTLERNTFGSTGTPFANTEVVIRRDDGSETALGEKGIVFARGPQVMRGYYKNPEATAAILSPDGWLNTGDIAVRSANGEVVIVGRAKDTIVLMGGENVEPEPLEEKMKESAYIDHAVVLGQDQKQLSAIIAVNEEELMRLAAELKLQPSEIKTEGKDSIEHDEVYSVLLKEVNALISKEHGFKPFERITRILPVKNDFSVGKELTQTLKVKRKYVEERFQDMVARLFGDGHSGKKR
ncbi:MAG: AMP-binding protein [Opitutae bacterium]|nr:AMP-binding protein [Opitutae bacterium]